MTSQVTLNSVDDIARVTINRPEVANALDARTISAFHRVLDDLERADSPMRCVVLGGEGKAFCSGIDLHGVEISKGHLRESGDIVARHHLDHLICRLVEFRLPIVAALRGPAIGAGMTIALTADIIVMSDEAYLQPSFARLGFVPDQGITYLLPRLIGAARARSALLLADRIDARTALDWGLCYGVYAPDVFESKVQAIAARLASGPTRVLGMTRRLCFGGNLAELRSHIEHERSAQECALQRSECAEGVQAFFEKRAPRFQAGKP